MKKYLLAFAAIWLSLVGAAYAETPLRLVVPYSAGGGSDVVARYIGEHLSQKIGQPVVVINQPGAGGYVGTQLAQMAPPDGNTLLVAVSTHTIYPATKKDLSFDVVKGFEPVMLMLKGPLVISVAPASPYKTMSQLIDYARQHPGSIKYASAGGIGSIPHLALELLSVQAGIKMVHVPYNSAPPAIIDVMSGTVPIIMSTIASVVPYFESKQLVPVAITSKQRSSVAPDIPTIAEQSGLDYDINYWIGFVAPPKTPAARVEQLRVALAEIAEDPKGRAFFKAQGFESVSSTSDDFSKFMETEVELWKDVAKSAKLEPQ